MAYVPPLHFQLTAQHAAALDALLVKLPDGLIDPDPLLNGVAFTSNLREKE